MVTPTDEKKEELDYYPLTSRHLLKDWRTGYGFLRKAENDN